jgi:putative membrane protein
MDFNQGASMSNPFIPKTALCAGLICIAFGVSGQTSTGSTGSAGGTTQGSTPTGPGATGATTPKMGATTPATGSGSTGAASAKLAGADKTFVEKAAIGGMAEVELGNLAQQKAASEDVKKFGARMVQDHSKANDELKQIASTKGVQLPSSLDKKHQSDMDRLQKMSGADFDKAYMSHMVDDHKEDVAEFKKEASGGRDSDVKGFASKTLPTLEEHLKMAQSTNDAVKKGGGAKTASK